VKQSDLVIDINICYGCAYTEAVIYEKTDALMSEFVVPEVLKALQNDGFGKHRYADVLLFLVFFQEACTILHFFLYPLLSDFFPQIANIFTALSVPWEARRALRFGSSASQRRHQHTAA
jgi:hypothetical protein